MSGDPNFDSPPANGLSNTLLEEVFRRLSFARSLPEVISIVRYGVRSATRADGVTFVLRESDQCHYWEEDAIEPLWKGQRFPIESCISGWSMLNNQVAVIEDVFADPRIPKDVYRPTFVKSLIMAPVGAAKPVAAIGAYWAAHRQFTEQEIAAIAGIAQAVPDLPGFAVAAE
ncbi:MAG TPA: GAF domain-containing protein [Rhizomicrobium sp.]|jgi:two-component system CheB/CheR fusion protein